MSRSDEPFDPVQKPRHYNSHPSGVECVELAHFFSFALGNVIKYVWRAGLKDSEPDLVDLAKADWYMQYALHQDCRTSSSAAHQSRCEGLLAKITPHHSEEIAGVLKHIAAGYFEQQDWQLREALLMLAWRELRCEIMKQQAKVLRALETDSTKLEDVDPAVLAAVFPAAEPEEDDGTNPMQRLGYGRGDD